MVVPSSPKVTPQVSPSSWQPPTQPTRSCHRDLPTSPCVPSHPPAGCPAPFWSELVQALALGFHLLSAKVVLHRFAVKIKKQLEGKNPWLVNRAEQPQTSHPGEEEGRESGAAWGTQGWISTPCRRQDAFI